MRLMIVTLSLAILSSLTESPEAWQAPPMEKGPTFEAVSIRRNTSTPDIRSGQAGSIIERPDGGFAMLNESVRRLITRVYPVTPADIIGLPEWVSQERYDIVAVAALRRTPTDADRRAMTLSMLRERFNFAAHYESREEDSWDLMRARSDGSLGPRLKPSAVDCEALAEENAAATAKGSKADRPTCGLRTAGKIIDGDTTIANLAFILRPMAGRQIVDKTGLNGYYRVTLEFDRLGALGRGRGIAADSLSIFTAVQEQLGLRLVSSRTTGQVLIVDRLERPTSN